MRMSRDQQTFGNKDQRQLVPKMRFYYHEFRVLRNCQLVPVPDAVMVTLTAQPSRRATSIRIALGCLFWLQSCVRWVWQHDDMLVSSS